jgi:hypothetical protein
MGTVDATTAQGEMLSDNGPLVKVIKISKTLTAAESTSLGADGVLQIADLYAGFLLLGGCFKVTTAAAATCNGQIGLTGGDTDGFMAVANMDSEAANQLSGALLDEGYLVTSDDTMDLLFDTAAPSTMAYELYLVGVQLWTE